MSSPGEVPEAPTAADGEAPKQPEGASAAAYMAQQADEATETEAEDMEESQEDPMDADKQADDDDEEEEEEVGEPDDQVDQEPTDEQPNAAEETVEEAQGAHAEDAEMEEEEEVIKEADVEEEIESKDESESVARSSRSQTAAEGTAPQITYSTRGRYQKEEDPLEALLAGVRAQGEEEREMMAATATTTSFLDSLNEEDRRTRTRHLPDLEGFRPLYKGEVKSDLALARSITSSSGQYSTLKRKGKKQKDDSQMDVDEGEGTGPSEDERGPDIGGKKVELDEREFSVPSKVFVAPKSDGIDGTIPSTKQTKNQMQSPYVVEAITAYNPPRPPESVGAKKKHRMLRWERRPQDVEVDLNNYKKTVRRTREELRNAEKERDRIQMFGAIMRVHFRDQLELLNEESVELNEELGAIQTECVSAADLLTSRTRSRGVGKGSYLMRDVISVVKQRGTELAEKGFPAITSQEEGNGAPGFGGVTSFGFIDWDKTTDVPVQKLAVGWTLPGDKVSTTYGDGVALHVFGPSILNVKEPLPIDLRPTPPPAAPAPAPAIASTNGNTEAPPDVAPSTGSAPGDSQGGDGDVSMGTETTGDTPKEDTTMEEKQGDAAEEPGAVKSSEPAAAAPAAKESEKSSKKADKNDKAAPDKIPSVEAESKREYRIDEILAPRVCVKLPFGIGFFPVGEVKSKENPAQYSDAQLASRWNKMVDSALLVGSCLDVSGMESVARASVVDRDYNIQSSMEIDDEESEENASGTEAKVTSTELLDKPKRHSESIDIAISSAERFVPYGANLLPTDAGRGSMLAKAPITTLEPPIQDEMFHTGGVLGRPGNPGVPRPAKTWEDMRQESYTLQSKVLHLRNELHRQRRIRALNERTHASFRNRSLRAEALVAEMRADLKSLKDRLGDEVGELGIDSEKAEGLLSAHYKKKDKEDLDSDAAPPKRTRRAVREAQPPVTLKTTRRRRANSSDFDAMGDNSGETDRYEDAMFEEKVAEEDANSSDEDSRRATKRARYTQ